MVQQVFLIKTFQQLSNMELYSILKLRQDVFILEQACFYEDLDGLDEVSRHILFYQDEKLAAYSRIIPPLQHRNFTSIGRIIVHPDYRSYGLGKRLVLFSIDKARSLFPDSIIRISAQQQLFSFYTDLGFKQISEPYDDAGIIHIDMIFKDESFS